MLEKVVSIHVEPTTRCNASCPGCPRNNFGYGLKEGLKLIDIDVNFLTNFFNKCFNLAHVHLCGNRGDPIAYKHLKSLLSSLPINKYSVTIHTNGSLRSTAWWAELGKYKSNALEVTFSIDGLADTNHIYRQATSFNKIIDNAKAFIDAGGNAVWKFLTFKHNQHQVEEARELASNLGFIDFYTELPYITDAYHWRTNQGYIAMELPEEENSVDVEQLHLQNINNFETEQTRIAKIENNMWVNPSDCRHLKVWDDYGMYSLFISADGIIHPCCFWEDERKESYSIESLDLDNEFSQGIYRKTCLEVCGTVK